MTYEQLGQSDITFCRGSILLRFTDVISQFYCHMRHKDGCVFSAILPSKFKTLNVCNYTIDSQTRFKASRRFLDDKPTKTTCS